MLEDPEVVIMAERTEDLATAPEAAPSTAVHETVPAVASEV